MWPRSLAGKPFVESLWEKTQLKSSTCNSYIKTDKESKIKLWFIWIHLDHDGPCRPPSVAAETFRLTTLAHLLLQSAQRWDRGGRRNRQGAARHRAGTPSARTKARIHPIGLLWKISEGINVKKWCENTDHGGKEHLPLSKFHFIWRCPRKKWVVPPVVIHFQMDFPWNKPSSELGVSQGIPRMSKSSTQLSTQHGPCGKKHQLGHLRVFLFMIDSY